MKVSEKAYIAALIDTDGSISIVKHKTTLNLRVGVRQNIKGVELLKKVKTMAGLGNISKGTNTCYNGKPYPMWQWQITDQQAKKLLLKVSPFMIRKKEQARLGIAFGAAKSMSHKLNSRKPPKWQRKLNEFYLLCRETLMWLNAPPTETKRERPKCDVDDLWIILHEFEMEFGHAIVQPTAL